MRLRLRLRLRARVREQDREEWSDHDDVNRTMNGMMSWKASGMSEGY